MSIFTLSLFICLRTYGLMGASGDMLSMSCRWQSAGLYSTEEKCEAAGAEQVGRPYYSDVSYFNGTETIDKSRCVSTAVR